MSIVCGVDGSANARAAARAAAAIAKLSRTELVLAYVQEALVLTVEPITGATPLALANTTYLEEDRKRMHAELEREGGRLARDFGIAVTHVIHSGLPDLELVRVAEEKGAELLVVGALGRRPATPWRIGSVADRLTQSAPVPLLVVRDAEALEKWALERLAPSIVVALGVGKPTHAAVRVARELAKLGPCELVEVHVYEPYLEARRRGLESGESASERTHIEEALRQELPRHFEQEGGLARESFVPVPAHGDLAETLAEFVESRNADLLVLGAHRRGALRRFFGSVTHGVLPIVETNVLVVPPKVVAAESNVPPRVRRALVATDLSPTGNRAMELAFGLLPDGSQLVLLYVDVPPQLPSGWIMGYHPTVMPTADERRTKRARAEGELARLARSRREGAVETLVEVVDSSDVAGAILDAAERHEVDLVCLGTHHHGRMASALIGSVARSVARRSTRPVLLVPVEPSA